MLLATAAAAADLPTAPLPGADLPGFGSLAVPAILLALLALGALLLGRRRRGGGRLVQVIESAPIGPKRSVVVCRVGDELLVLGSSEAGVALLATRPAPAAPVTALEESQAGLLAKMGLSRKPGFEELLAESTEDLELRRTLAAGRAASVA